MGDKKSLRMDIDPSYYAITTAEVLYSDSLNDAEILLYTVISGLARKEGYCWATNDQLADLRKKSAVSISRQVKHIEKLGFFKIEYDYYGKIITKRRIFPLTNVSVIKNDNGGTIIKNDEGAVNKNDQGANIKNDKDISIININKNINIEDHFNLVWKLYPLKKGKGKISLSKKKVMSNFTVDEWSVIIKRYDTSVLDKTFLMHGSTFFNGGYLDYTDENYQEQKFLSEKKKYTDTSKYNYTEGKASITDEEKENNINLLSQFKKRG